LKTVTVTIDEIWKIYFWGMSEGQLLMEEERDSEETFDAALCAIGSRKYGLPTIPVRRRQVYNEEWFEEMRKRKVEFAEFVKAKIKETT
jgi:hypothetical protein